MQEEMKKNFVLLSKIAKEKKYAQEYLGLLARRGDIGSIRIGKRWYTTREWFSEFLADAEAKKVEMKNAKAGSELAELKIPKNADIKKTYFPEKVDIKMKADEVKKEIQKEEKEFPIKLTSENNWEKLYARKESVVADNINKQAVEMRKAKIAPTIFEAETSFQVKKKFETVDLRKIKKEKSLVLQKVPAKSLNGVANTRLNVLQRSDSPQLVKKEKKIREWKFRSKGSSPNFASDSQRMSLFDKFAFSAAAVLLLVLIFQFGLVFKNDIKKFAGIDSGSVAGAEDSKVGLSSIKDSSLGYLANQEGRVRENISFSRVLIKAAIERESEEKK
jgi:hypothetical protein